MRRLSGDDAALQRPAAAAGPADAEHRARLVLFAAGDAQGDGRRARRERVLALRPVDQTEEIATDHLLGAPDGVHWEYLLPDDSALLVRARDLADAEEARWDAERLFAAATRPRVLYVRDRAAGHLSWWLVRGSEPVIVSSRVWLPSQRGHVVRSARRALAALKVRPVWGQYSG